MDPHSRGSCAAVSLCVSRSFCLLLVCAIPGGLGFAAALISLTYGTPRFLYKNLHLGDALAPLFRKGFVGRHTDAFVAYFANVAMEPGLHAPKGSGRGGAHQATTLLLCRVPSTEMQVSGG